MSYQVLARKWRPRTFAEMVGQEHVLRAMINTLDQGRLHHAYLFTGTRGVGKTTIARILAKSLNCDIGVTSAPCGTCSACREIDEGRFVDLIEVDAASRTKVEDTRELLDNVQYAPTRGRYKVYLIDEVHMLSGHSFNALLKTLEEPPLHVKFLLATTDPQKLPVTILSRCLQFSLKAMPAERIVGHLQKVLSAEQVIFEDAALWGLARAAQGSMRDAMSLTDQAIAFGAGAVRDAEVAAMLGTLDRHQAWRLLEPLASGNVPGLFAAFESLASHAPDYVGLLGDLLQLLHRLATAQIFPDAVDNSDGDRQQVISFAGRMTPEDIQLFYQIGLAGRRDIAFAPDPRCGFEMTLMRMLMFRPVPPDGSGRGFVSDTPASSGSTSVPAVTEPAAVRKDNVVDFVPRRQEPVVTDVPQHRPQDHSQDSGAEWHVLVEGLGLTGPALNFARNCGLQGREDSVWTFVISPGHQMLSQPQHVTKLEEQLSRHVGSACKVRLEVRESAVESPAGRLQRLKREADSRADAAFREDGFVKGLVQEFDAVIESHSIRPV